MKTRELRSEETATGRDGTAKPEGGARAGIESLLLWIFLALKGLNLF